MAQVRAHLKAAERNAEFEKARKEGLLYCPPHARKRTEEDKKREERKEARRVRRESRKTRRGQRAEQDNARKEREEARRANNEKRAAAETAHEMEMNAIAYRLCERMLEDVKKSMNAIVYRL